ncbi:MAG TPA: beta-mannosidase [Polyangiaceae bacterium]
MVRPLVLALLGVASACGGHTNQAVSASPARAAKPARGLARETPAPAAPAPAAAEFVRVSGKHFTLRGAPHRFVGVNFWYGAYLAADGDIGDLERLRAELAALRTLGITNLRVLGASEASPMKDAIQPSFRGPGRDYNETLLVGLDRLLAEMAALDLKAVIYLNNFWGWSGGMGTYLSWVNGGKFVDMSDPKKPWPAYPLFTMQFYDDARANALYQDYMQAVILRTNSVTGVAYKDDPTIMAWQLANEPRPGHDTKPGKHVLPAFYRWVDESAAFIKSLDPSHLVSSGNEGSMGCVEHDPCFIEAHSSQHIDYLTLHLWPQNWGWLDARDIDATAARAVEKSGEYLDRHIAAAETLGKPLVLEEFGWPRDGAALHPVASTRSRDRFFRFVFDRVEKAAAAGRPLAGSNVWAWGGFGRAAHADMRWRHGDTSYIGDPPHEPQGWYSVFDTDASTLELLRAHAKALE